MSQLSASEFLSKSPNETKDFSMEFANWLDSGETITAITSVTSALRGGSTSDLTISDTSVSGTKVLMTIADGTKNKRYTIFVLITTSSGQTLEGEGNLRIKR